MAKNPIPVALLALLALIELARLTAPRPAAAEVLNRVVLRVNDQIATLYDYERRRADMVREITHRVEDPNERRQALAQVPESVFRDLFQELLLSSRADQAAIEVTDQEVDQQLVDMRQSFGIKTDEEFLAALQQSGMTLEQLRAQTRRNLRIRQLIGKEVTAKIKIKDEELRRYYRQHQEEYAVPEQVQLREVVVLDDSGLPESERARIAADVRATVAAGKSLADATAAYAAKRQVSSVVELGWVSPKDLDPKLEEAAWKLPKNGLSEPIPARGGVHLLQLIDRHPAHVKPFAEVQAAIQQQEQERIFRENSVKYIAELEAKSLVVADPPPAATNFRRKMGAVEDPSLKGLAGAGSTPEAPATPPGAAAPADVAGEHPASVDTTGRKEGGLPAPKPVGAPPREPVTIPPPSNIPPPPPSVPPPPQQTTPPPQGTSPPAPPPLR